MASEQRTAAGFGKAPRKNAAVETSEGTAEAIERMRRFSAAVAAKEKEITVYERFTDRARKVMQLANQEAQRFNHAAVGAEHILLGLVKEGSGVAAGVLKNLDIDLRKIRLEIEKLVEHAPGGVEAGTGRLPHTPQAAKAVRGAIEEAQSLGCDYVGTEHILLGLTRDPASVAGVVLAALGVNIDGVRRELLAMLAAPAEPAEPPKAETPRWHRVAYRVTVEPVAALAAEVDKVAGQRDALARLCGEIVATLTLPANQEQLKVLGGGFAMVVKSWERRFKECGGEGV
jgi:hypothetical protein